MSSSFLDLPSSRRLVIVSVWAMGSLLCLGSVIGLVLIVPIHDRSGQMREFEKWYKVGYADGESAGISHTRAKEPSLSDANLAQKATDVRKAAGVADGWPTSGYVRGYGAGFRAGFTATEKRRGE